MQLNIIRPVPFQVLQREYRIEQENFAAIPIEVGTEADISCIVTARYRVMPLANAFGCGLDWSELEFEVSGKQLTGKALIPAGGWYRLEVECLFRNGGTTEAAVEPFGVGEVLVIAGQSNADCCSEVLTTIDDPQGRVTAYDIVNNNWSIANDPFPNMETGGSIWPSMCNLLLPELRVPIGLVNVARNASASREWLPGEELYESIAGVAEQVGMFRAILWQQGESDVIENTDADTYVDRLKQIRAALAEHWGFAPTWLLAKSTLHPYVYNFPDREAEIREAIERLWNIPGFAAGPDTDVLTGENRAPLDRGGHFSEIGQKRAGAMWYAAILKYLKQCSKDHKCNECR